MKIKEIDIELTLSFCYEISPAEPDVGIMHPFVYDLDLIGHDGKVMPHLHNLLTDKQIDSIEEQLLEDEA